MVYTNDVAVFLAKLGVLTQRAGRVDEARQYFEEALAIRKRLSAGEPDNSKHPYEIACIQALMGEAALALQALTRAVDLGWVDADHAAEDSDLSCLRELPDFAALLRRMRDSPAGGA
jgi:tetratricopeptide (TPR) repeat protein